MVLSNVDLPATLRLVDLVAQRALHSLRTVPGARFNRKKNWPEKSLEFWLEVSLYKVCLGIEMEPQAENEAIFLFY